MKLFLNLFIFLIVYSFFENKSHSLTDYKIKNICKKNVKKEKCIQTYKEKRFNLQKGNFIKIPVIPYKKR